MTVGIWDKRAGLKAEVGNVCGDGGGCGGGGLQWLDGGKIQMFGSMTGRVDLPILLAYP